MGTLIISPLLLLCWTVTILAFLGVFKIDSRKVLFKILILNPFVFGSILLILYALFCMRETERTTVGFFLFGNLILGALAVLLLRRLRKRGVRVNRWGYLAIFVVLMTWDNIYANVALQYYCYKYGGEHIYQVAHNVDGYFDEGNNSGGIDLRDLSNYKFIECNKTRKMPWFYPNDTGLYRYSRAEKGSPLCRAYYDYYKERSDYEERLKEPYCVACEKVDTLKSRYSFRAVRNEEIAPLIRANIYRVKDLQTGELLGISRKYGHLQGWLGYACVGDMGVDMTCPKDFKGYDILGKVLNFNK